MRVDEAIPLGPRTQSPCSESYDAILRFSYTDSESSDSGLRRRIA